MEYLLIKLCIFFNVKCNNLWILWIYGNFNIFFFNFMFFSFVCYILLMCLINNICSGREFESLY